ncbi:hypothetical protein L6452_15270 [Arctium lappa]|uniref:Uncharacterized protein n=1 Tax=Arctium lappa TaxID=4217 RepID=A0ACB9CN37_ARCLA|nr:hypothetical protein L6452_15270 [Arctium lappa]
MKKFQESSKGLDSENTELKKKISELEAQIVRGKKEDIKKNKEKAKERNSLSTKIKELEGIIFKVELSAQKSPDTIAQSPLNDSSDLECSFKTTSSSHHTNVSSNRSVNPKDQIRTTNLFYDKSVDGSCNIRKNNVQKKVV